MWQKEKQNSWRTKRPTKFFSLWRTSSVFSVDNPNSMSYTRMDMSDVIRLHWKYFFYFIIIITFFLFFFKENSYLTLWLLDIPFYELSQIYIWINLLFASSAHRVFDYILPIIQYYLPFFRIVWNVCRHSSN